MRRSLTPGELIGIAIGTVGIGVTVGHIAGGLIVAVGVATLVYAGYMKWRDKNRKPLADEGKKESVGFHVENGEGNVFVNCTATGFDKGFVFKDQKRLTSIGNTAIDAPVKNEEKDKVQK